MKFGEAIEKLKAGERVARVGWNGKGMWLALTPGSIITLDQARAGAAMKVADELMSQNFLHSHPRRDQRSMIIDPHIDMRTAGFTLQVGWLASQADMLAEDWVVVEVTS